MNQLHRVRNRIIPSKSFLSVGRQTGFWLVRSWFLSEYYGTFSRASSSRSDLISSWLDIQISCSAVNIINFVQSKTIWSNKSKLSQLNHKSKRNKILDFSKLSKNDHPPNVRTRPDSRLKWIIFVWWYLLSLLRILDLDGWRLNDRVYSGFSFMLAPDWSIRPKNLKIEIIAILWE